jgi:hypothetical protein
VLIMGAPDIDPNRRFLSGSVLDAYQPGQRVWVHRSGSWRPGIILHCTSQAATVRYRPAEGIGTGVDTVTGYSLADRADDDPYLDRLQLVGSRGIPERPVVTRAESILGRPPADIERGAA